MCNLTHKHRLAVLAEGFPIILSSARSLWKAARRLEDEMPREAAVLRGFAEEEASKALILMDYARCPIDLINSNIGKIITWFYSHLARLIYAKSMKLKETNVVELREYVNLFRPSHDIEGDYAEHIIPNWDLYEREGHLYADIVSNEAGYTGWSDPLLFTSDGHLPLISPRPFLLVESMAALGIFSSRGLRATSQIWGQKEFTHSGTSHDAKVLTEKLLERLNSENLQSIDVTQGHVETLYRDWQLPMYDFDFSPIRVSHQDLEALRSRISADYYW